MLDFVTGIIGTILYPLFSIVFVLVDTMQGLFRSFAGVSDITVSTGRIFGTVAGGGKEVISGGDVSKFGTEKGTGIVFYFLNTPLVKNMLMSIFILAIFLLIIFTVMAFIRNAYASKQKTWQEIIGNTIKGLLSFIIIPVGCLLGVWASNILLIVIDGATSNGGATSLGRKLFVTCAYNANVFRSDKNIKPDDYYDFAVLYNTEVDASAFAQEIQAVKDAGAKEIKDKKEKVQESVEAKFGSGDAGIEAIATEIDRIYALEDGPGIYWHWQVASHYALYRINYIVLIVGGVFMMYVMINLTYGMIKRLFYLIMLYIISPAICAMYPLDDGKAVGSWKSTFFKETVSAYAAVVGLNIFFSIIPLISQIEVLKVVEGGVLLNNVIQLIILTSGLFIVKDFISTVAGFYGGGDAYSAGQSLRSTTKTSMKDKAKLAGKKTGAFIGGAVRLGRKGANIISNQADRIHANKEAGLTGLSVAFKGSLGGWRFGTTDEEKKSAHDSRMNARSLAEKNSREEKLAKMKYKASSESESGPSWRNLDEKTKRRYLGAARFDERGEDARYAKKQGLTYKTMSESEKQAIHDKRMAEIKSHQGFGSETVAGQTVRSLGKASAGIGKAMLGDIWKEAELSYKEKDVDAEAAASKKATQAKKGEYSEKEALEQIVNLLKQEDKGVILKGATSEALTAMSNSMFKEKVFGDATKGKVSGFDWSAIGMNAKTATIEGVQN